GLRCPRVRPYAGKLEFQRQIVRISGDVGVDAFYVCVNEPLGFGMVAGPLTLIEGPSELGQTTLAIALDRCRPQNLRKAAFILPPPPFHLPETALGPYVALAKEQVIGGLRIAAADAPI